MRATAFRVRWVRHICPLIKPPSCLRALCWKVCCCLRQDCLPHRSGSLAAWQVISVEVELACHALSLIGPLIALAEVAQLPLPYYHLHQRSTYGTSRWADPLWLKDLGLVRLKGTPLQPSELPLGSLGTRYDAVLHPAQTMCHLALFGPPGSGKSATFFMTWLRAWAAHGSAIMFDPKGSTPKANCMNKRRSSSSVFIGLTCKTRSVLTAGIFCPPAATTPNSRTKPPPSSLT